MRFLVDKRTPVIIKIVFTHPHTGPGTMLKKYLLLTKPGIIAGNAITAVAGYLLVEGQFHLIGFLSMLFGLSFIIGSACVFNNYMDRSFDQKMTRTRHRSLATGAISNPLALIWGGALLMMGIASLLFGTNMLCLCSALFGFIVYVGLYTPIKVRSLYGTLIGSIAGAAPPVVGYTAAKDTLDLTAFLLFLLIALWQMPHFYAIAIYRLEEYKNAGIPVLPYVRGIDTTKKHMIFYTLGFGLSALILYAQSSMGMFYLALSSLSTIAWIFVAIDGMKTMDANAWAKRMFRCSLIVMISISVAMSIH